jgi:hypothetical protein
MPSALDSPVRLVTYASAHYLKGVCNHYECMGVNTTDQLFELWWLTEYDDTTCGWIVHEA